MSMPEINTILNHPLDKKLTENSQLIELKVTTSGLNEMTGDNGGKHVELDVDESGNFEESEEAEETLETGPENPDDWSSAS
jgi:hypothetical protein